MNAKEQVLKLAQGEQIEGINIGKMGGYYYDKEEKSLGLFIGEEKVKEALKLLDYEFDNSYGAENAKPIYVWTKSWVIFKCNYDGSEWYDSIPRNPSEEEPNSIGGG